MISVKITEVNSWSKKDFGKDIYHQHRYYNPISKIETVDEAEKIAEEKASKLKRKYWWRVFKLEDEMMLYRSHWKKEEDTPMHYYEASEFPKDCPRCNSDDIETEQVTPRSYGLSVDHLCNSCGGKWFTTYSFSTHHKYENLSCG